ncbi:MAG: hypothetical protein ACUVXI_08590 [bacterium]
MNRIVLNIAIVFISAAILLSGCEGCGGKVTIEGTVKDLRGKAISFATVSAYDEGAIASATRRIGDRSFLDLSKLGSPTYRAETDKLGGYFIEDAEPGRYILLASRSGYSTGVEGIDPETKSFTEDFAIAVSSKHRTIVDFEIAGGEFLGEDAGSETPTGSLSLPSGGWSLVAYDENGKVLADATDENAEVDVSSVEGTNVILKGRYTLPSPPTTATLKLAHISAGKTSAQISTLSLPLSSDGEIKAGDAEEGRKFAIPRDGGKMVLQLSDGVNHSHLVILNSNLVRERIPVTIILSWDTPDDLDLRVWNNAGEEAWFGNKKIETGALGSDVLGGYGPEIFVGNGTSYTIRVNYWRGTGTPTASVRVIQPRPEGGTSDKMFTHTFTREGEWWDVAEISW